MNKKGIYQDWDANWDNPKGRYIMLLFRIAQSIRRSGWKRKIFAPYLWGYRFWIEWCMNIELNWNAEVGSGLRIFHGHGLVVNGGTVIGKNCILRQGTTLGNIQKSNGHLTNSPVLGDNVEVGANVCILGDVTVGNNAMIGAGAIVLKSIGDNEVWAGNPAKYIRTKS